MEPFDLFEELTPVHFSKMAAIDWNHSLLFVVHNNYRSEQLDNRRYRSQGDEAMV